MDGTAVQVERRVLDLLVFLIENRHRVVTKDEIQDAVWPGTIVTETALTRAIMKARRALGDSAEAQTVIRTSHGEGYRFVADVKVLSGEPSPSVEDTLVDTGGRKMPGWLLAASLVLLAGFLGFAGWTFLPESPVTTSAPPVQSPEPGIIAVLPFENLSPDPDQGYFASGIHEEILNEIARGTNLKVIARTSVAQYAGTTMTIPEIARELGVRSVVEGSVRYADDRVRITAQLIDGQTGLHMWSNSYDRDFADIFRIQSDIAREIAGALEAQIQGTSPLSGGDSVNVAAYKEYLLARSLRYRTFEVGWEPVLEHTRRALELDASYIPALGLLHNAYQNRILGDSDEAAHREMLAITARAALRDPQHPITLALRARDAANQWQWLEATRLWDEAITADPSDADNVGTAAFINIGAGRLDAAGEIIREGLKLNPAHDWPHYADMLLKLAKGDEVGAEETGRLIIAMGGNRAFPAAATLAMRWAEKGDSAKVAEFGETITRMTGGALKGFVEVLAAHAQGKQIHKDQVTAMLTANPPPNTYQWMGTQLYLMAGATEEAFATLDDIVASRSSFSVLRIVADPVFTDMRSDPRYADFLRRVGLPSSRPE